MNDSKITKRHDVEKPIDEIGSLDDQFEDLMFAAEHSRTAMQRVALCVDATSSMGGVWALAKDALKQAVDEIHKRSSIPVEICVVAYRDHTDDPPEYVVEASDWSADSHYLHDFIGKMRCHGGGDYPESIGHGLAFLLKDQAKQQGNPISQVILIGDAPSKHGSLGYVEAQTFGLQKCPVYALYTNDVEGLVECFQKLARLSGGKAFHLRSLSDMAEIFTILLAKNPALQIEYTPTSAEGKRLVEAMK